MKVKAMSKSVKRYFELGMGSESLEENVSLWSMRFYEIVIDEILVTVRTGIISTLGVSEVIKFDTQEDANNYFNERIDEIIKEGYVEHQDLDIVEIGSKGRRVSFSVYIRAMGEPEYVQMFEDDKESDLPDIANESSSSVEFNDEKWIPEFDCNGALIGPCPETVDLSDNDFENFSSESCLISFKNLKTIKTLIIPSYVNGASALYIENLPALETLNIEISNFGSMFGFQWIEIFDAPNLKSVKITGGARSIYISGSNNMEIIDISECSRIDEFDIGHQINPVQIKALGCVKLRPSIYSKNNKDLENQISENQSKSKLDGTIYDDMTYMDVDEVLKIINEGVKAIGRSGRMSEGKSRVFGNYGFWVFDPDFIPYYLRFISDPEDDLDTPYTGSTEETYAYSVMERVPFEYDSLRIGDEMNLGNTSQEDCLKYILNDIRMRLGNTLGIANFTDQQTLEFLRKESINNPIFSDSRFSILIDNSLDVNQSSEIKRLAENFCIEVVDHPGNSTICVRSEFDLNDSNSAYPYKASINIDYANAVSLINQYSEWVSKRDLRNKK